MASEKSSNQKPIAQPELNIVTGAFSYNGKYITSRLLSLGKRVRTLTGHPRRPNPFGDKIEVAPLRFDTPSELTRSMIGATTLYNTYWIRFSRGARTFEKAVENTRVLIQSAEEAGVKRIVHLSVTHACESSPLPYFRGKGLAERAIMHSKLSYAILRPTVIFGAEDILINNIAWLLRHFPLFAIFGSGDYSLQPVFVEDVAELAVSASTRDQNLILDAAGPETYSFQELIRLIQDKIQSKARIVHLSPRLAPLLCALLGYFVDDVVLTTEELRGLMSNLLVSKNPPTGRVRFSEWLAENAPTVGVRYASELNRHYR